MKMEHPGIDEDLLADRYVAGKLSAEERDRFEEHFFDCAACLEAIEVIHRFRNDLKEVGPSEPPAPLPSSFPRTATFLLAASLAAAVFSALYFYREERGARRELQAARRTSERAVPGDRAGQEPDAARALRAAPLAASVFTLNLTRGAGSPEPDNRVSLGASPHWLVLLFDQPNDDAAGTYRVILKTADGKPLGASVDASATSSGLLAAGFRSDVLAPGDYALTVESTAPGRPEPLATYRFRAVP